MDIFQLISNSASTTGTAVGYAFYRQSDPVEIVNLKKDDAAFGRIKKEVAEKTIELEGHMEFLARARNAMTSEIRATQRMSDQFKGTEEVKSDAADHLGSDNNFLFVCFRSANILRDFTRSLQELVTALDVDELAVPDQEKGGDAWDAMARRQLVGQTYGPVVKRFVGAVFGIEAVKGGVLECADHLVQTLEGYYKALVHRHSVEGVQVHGNPIQTDVALSIFHNVDAHGEIEAGGDTGKVSAYTMRKAQILVRALEEEPVKGFVRRQGEFLRWLSSSLEFMWRTAEKLSTVFSKHLRMAKERYEAPYRRVPPKSDLEHAVQFLRDMDPDLVKYKDRAVLLNAEERYQNQFMNETLDEMVKLMKSDQGLEKVVQHVLDRRARLKKHDQEENTFYVCKIGAGNNFKGVAPGALEITPQQRPHVEIDKIWGSGFDDLRDFLESISMSAEWHDLFVATSPTKTADKSNILMIGPQGCGKSQMMRAIASDRKSIAIHAQGSDFNTAWMGEAEKNPKRLFQHAHRIQKETGMHVYILIDECDSVMKRKDLRKHGEVDLTLEFQILMDGVVHYPRITIVGATNHPGHMPMTMLRRFSKPLIVGELDDEARIAVLRHYAGFMPLKGFKDEDWTWMSNKMKGAVGDVLRKVVDAVWRKKMTWFIKHQEKRAREMLNWLNGEVKFDIKDFDGKRRTEFKKLLGPHVSITPDDLRASVEEALKNLTVKTEIETAVATYEEARKLVDDIRSGSGLIIDPNDVRLVRTDS